MARKPGLGITLPVQRGATGFFNVAFDALTQIKSNLTNLILTKKGERVMQPEFGCDIHNLLFEQITDDIQANARGTIEEAAQIWMPFVSIDDVQIRKDEDHNTTYVTVSFSLKTSVNVSDTITLVI